MSALLFAFLIGVVSGLRSLTAPAAVWWAAHAGRLHLESTALSWIGSTAGAWIFTVLALAEIVNDKMPKTPSRKAPGPFIVRVLLGGLSGAAIGAAAEALVAGAIAGAVGAVVGTLGGYELRVRLARAAGGKDLPIALLEDAIAIGGAAWIMLSI